MIDGQRRAIGALPDAHRAGPIGEAWGTIGASGWWRRRQRAEDRAGRRHEQRCRQGWRHRGRGHQNHRFWRRAIDKDKFDDHIDIIPHPCPVDNHMGVEGDRPRIKSHVDIDKIANDIGRQHDDADAAGILKLRDELGFLQKHGDLGARRNIRALATCAELAGFYESPECAIVEGIGGDGFDHGIGRHRGPAGPVRTGAPEHPGRAEFLARHPEPADLLIMHPAAVMMHDLAPGGLVIIIPAVLPGVDPVARLIRVPAWWRHRRNPDFAESRILYEIARLHKNAAHIVFHRFRPDLSGLHRLDRQCLGLVGHRGWVGIGLGIGLRHHARRQVRSKQAKTGQKRRAGQIAQDA